MDPLEKTLTRSQITRALKWRYSGNKVDALTFCVSHDIMLTGIGLCRPYKTGGQIRVNKFTILSGRSSESKIVYTHKKIVKVASCTESSVGKIPLVVSFLVKRGVMYTVSLVIEGSPSFK